MATESVEKFDPTDRIQDLAYKARGIAATIRCAAGTVATDSKDAIPGACWAIEDMLREISDLAGAK